MEPSTKVDIYQRGGGWTVELVAHDKGAVEIWYVHPQPDTSKPAVMSPAAARANAVSFGRRVANLLDIPVYDEGRAP